MHVGGFILGNASSRACDSFFCAVANRGVPALDDVSFITLTLPPFSEASAWNFSMALRVPATLAPFGKYLPVSSQQPPDSLAAASLQRDCTTSSARAATVTWTNGFAACSAATASQRFFTNGKASSTVSTPAAQSATYCPTSIPHTAAGCWALAGLTNFRSSKPAKPAANTAIAPCPPFCICSRPSAQHAATSKPKAFEAFFSMAFTSTFSLQSLRSPLRQVAMPPNNTPQLLGFARELEAGGGAGGSATPKEAG
mmetsp:Transcript_51088/g.119601  ORF Transcript_51088/g.119601 Transcript_51088/m.119601 type:complete len:255 (+) Transcript_51088:375-1139(+)